MSEYYSFFDFEIFEFAENNSLPGLDISRDRANTVLLKIKNCAPCAYGYEAIWEGLLK